VTAYFLGLAIGQLVHGPLADRFGRRPTLYTGFALYGVGAVLAILAPSFSLLLLARFVWGLGAAGPRVVTVAVIRDTYDGDRMSRAMSFVMAVFLIVPVLAPTIGAGSSPWPAGAGSSGCASRPPP
jgi:MFS transporter, DHA1 family, multidrug resistance protein